MSISDRLDQIEARADAATEGPWGFIADTNLIGMTKEWRIGSTEAMADVAATPRFGTDSADAEFIAASRSDVPALVAAVRAVLDLHKPRHEHALAAACSTESCDCEDGCRTVPTEVCGHCIDTGMSAHHYAYEEGGIETVLWPCPTVRAIATALGEDQP